MLKTYNFSERGGGRPLLIVHGLFGSARNWNVIAKKLSATRPVVTVDMRNHGASPRFDTQSYHDMGDDLAEVIDSLGEVDLVGHSMGGKAAMVAAVSGSKINRLIVADIAPVSYGHTQLPLIEAMRAVDLSTVERRSDAEAQLTSVEDTSVRAFLLQSLDIKEKRWTLNLDTLAAEMPKILSFPHLEGSFEGPTLFLSGGASDYVLPEHRAEIKRLFPTARFAKIPGAGHWLHAEKPKEFMATVDAFLDAL